MRLCLALSPDHKQAAYALASLLAARGAFTEADALFCRDLPVLCDNGHTTWTRMLRLPLPGRPLGWPAPAVPQPVRHIMLPAVDAASSADVVYLVGADSRYLGLFARPLAASIARSGVRRVLLHLHAVNPTPETIALLDELRSGPVSVIVSTEQAALDGLDETEQRCFYACSRFLILPDLLAMYNLPILVADIDQLVLRPPTALLSVLGDADAALLRFDNARHNILSLVSATLMLAGAGLGGRRFAETLRDWLLARMAEDGGLAWHLDQAALAVVHLGLEGLRWVGIDPTLVHLDQQPPDADSPAAFWSITHSIAANAAKMETSAFRTLIGPATMTQSAVTSPR